MTLEGPSRYRKQPDHKKEIKAMMGIISGDIKIRRARGKDKGVRKQPERELRNDVIKELRKHGVTVMRIENAIHGRHNIGCADLIVFNTLKHKGGFLELKSDKGILLDEQKQFRDNCALCGISYWVARTVSEALEYVG